MRHFLFGYGSLISKHSRDKTAVSGVFIPVRAQGIKRGWIIHIPQYGVTALGAMTSKNGYCNGVVFEVDESEIPKYDEREIGYDRVKIDQKNIVALEDYSIPSAMFWAYVNNKEEFSTKEYPIIQSYIDVILTGCFEISEDFARKFIRTTYGWNSEWINDRKDPRYPRAMKNVNEQSIDNILMDELKENFVRK